MITGTADKVVDDTVEAARTVFAAEIEAIYTLGSLAHGGFAPRVSDVDVAILDARHGRSDRQGPEPGGRQGLPSALGAPLVVLG